MADRHQIIMLANTVKGDTQQIRDIFPNDMPYLWEQLAPIIENIESCASSIKSIAKEM